MKNSKLYAEFIKELSGTNFDIYWTNSDFAFEHVIGLDNSLNIRKFLYDDIQKRYNDRVQEIISETIAYKFENEFFKVLEIHFEYAEDLFHDYLIMDNDVFVVNYDNNEKKLSFYIKCHHPLIIDFCKVRLALLIGYYQYLTQNAISNEFVNFMNYIISINYNQLSNSTNIFESLIIESEKNNKPLVVSGVVW